MTCTPSPRPPWSVWPSRLMFLARSGACTRSSFSWSALVGSVGADEVVDLVVGVDRLAGVAPEAVEHVVLHHALGDEPVVDVGDLQLAAPGRHQVGDHLEDGLVVEVDAGDAEAARRVVGLLDDAGHAA